MLQTGRYRLQVLSILLFFVAKFSFAFGEPAPKAKRGLLEIKNWNFEEMGPLPLNGEWEFYWSQLLTPENELKANPDDRQYFNLPGVWNGFQGKDSVLHGKGYATYKLLIRHVQPGKPLALEIPAIYCSYKLWVNGLLISENGIVGDHKDKAKGQWLPITKTIASAGGNIEIIWQVSNFHHRLGGISDQLILGDPDQLFAKRNNGVIANMLLVGGLGLMSAFLFGFFFFFRKDMATFYFAVFCFTWMIRSLFTNLYLIIFFFPNFNWELAVKIEYITLYTATVTGFLFIVHIFGRGGNKRTVNILLIIIYSFIALTLATPVYIFSHLLVPFQFFIILILAYFIYVAANAIINDRKEAWFSVVSVILAVIMFAYNLFAVHDFVASDTVLLSIGYLFVFLLNSFVLGHRFAQTLKASN